MTGVGYSKSHRRYRARITFRKKHYHLGWFATEREAELERTSAEEWAGLGLPPFYFPRLRCTNTSGIDGVYPKRGKWQAFGRNHGKKVYLGTFIKASDAIKARLKFLKDKLNDNNGDRPSKASMPQLRRSIALLQAQVQK